jgi:hypothetical protein
MKLVGERGVGAAGLGVPHLKLAPQVASDIPIMAGTNIGSHGEEDPEEE